MSGEAPVVIRPLLARDRAGWDGLWQAYLAFYGTSLPEEVTEVTFARLLAGEDGPWGFVALAADARLVGLVHFLYHGSTWSVAPRCYLQDLFVEPSARGGGIGRKLIEAVYGAADVAGAAEVYWLTQDFNVTARRLYDAVAEKTPFIKYRRLPAAKEPG